MKKLHKALTHKTQINGRRTKEPIDFAHLHCESTIVLQSAVLLANDDQLQYLFGDAVGGWDTASLAAAVPLGAGTAGSGTEPAQR